MKISCWCYTCRKVFYVNDGDSELCKWCNQLSQDARPDKVLQSSNNIGENSKNEPKKLVGIKSIVIGVDDFDSLVKATYGKMYSFQQQSFMGHGLKTAYIKGEVYDYVERNINNGYIYDERFKGVNFEQWKKANIKEVYSGGWKKDKWWIDMYLSREFFPSSSMVIQDLIHRNLLEDSDCYIVEYEE